MTLQGLPNDFSKGGGRALPLSVDFKAMWI
jgi:hypothetical protein